MTSWAKVGAKVVCVDPTGMCIHKGEIYEIAQVVWGVGSEDLGYGLEGLAVHLVGVDRPFGTPYAVARFRPLVTRTQEQDVEMFLRLVDRVPNMETAQ